MTQRFCGVSHTALLVGLSSSHRIGRVYWHIKTKYDADVVTYKTGTVSHDGDRTFHEPAPCAPEDAAWIERTSTMMDRSMELVRD